MHYRHFLIESLLRFMFGKKQVEPWEGGWSLFRNYRCPAAVADNLGENSLLKQESVQSLVFFYGLLVDLLLGMPSLSLRRVQQLKCVHLIF